MGKGWAEGVSNSLIFVPPNLSQEGEEDTPEMMMIDADRFSFLTRLFLILLLIVSGASQLPFSRVSAGLGSQRPPETVIFAVSREGDAGNMDAVVIINGKHFRQPFTQETKDKQTTFANHYFAAGQSYRLLFGGGDAGSVTVKKWSEGCNSVHAEVTPATSVKLGGHVMALATNSESLGKRASARRAPTDQERAAVINLMRGIYSQHRTPARMIDSIRITNLTATDLDGDGKYEMIGSFTEGDKNKFERDLFLIAHQAGNTMRADLIKFQAYQPPAEGFLSSVDFIDQVDLDGDRIGEILATQGGFDAYGFLIFKKVNGRWRQVYEGIGDAC